MHPPAFTPTHNPNTLLFTSSITITNHARYDKANNIKSSEGSIIISIATRNVSGYNVCMIISFKHKGLKLYYEKGSAAKLPPEVVKKIRLVIARLDAISSAEEMNIAGYRFHALTGDLKGFYSVRVTANYRVIFAMSGENVRDVDFIDYH